LAILLNEAAAKEFGFENPVGEEVLYNDGRQAFKNIK
jgi:hypothetical protein